MFHQLLVAFTLGPSSSLLAGVSCVVWILKFKALKTWGQLRGGGRCGDREVE